MRLAAALALCLAALPADAEEFGPPCLTPETAMLGVRQHGATAAWLDGQDAADLLRAVNEIPPESDYRAETVIVVLRPDRAVLGLFGVCHIEDVMVRLDAFADAWRKARGEGV